MLAVTTSNPSTVYYPSFDGNGNITAWTQSGATAPVCRRENDAFGNIVVEQGAAHSLWTRPATNSLIRMNFTLRLPLIYPLHGSYMIRAFSLIFMVMLSLSTGTANAEPAKPLDDWLGKLVVGEEVDFAEAVKRNKVPKEVFGNKGRLGEILKRHGLANRQAILQSFSNNSVCYVYPVNEMYDIALFGTATGSTEMDSYIGGASVIRNLPRDDLAKGLRQFYGKALISDPKVRSPILKP